jgi:Beta-propeller domains of methanol dehydrogenase type
MSTRCRIPLAAAHQWVGDNAGVLGPEYSALIHSACEALKAKTGAECAVITVDDLGGLSVEDFAARLFQRFGIGEAGKENGLLLLFFAERPKSPAGGRLRP